MGMYYRVVRPYAYEPVCMLLYRNWPPLSENPRIEPRFPDGGWVGRIRFVRC